jgi:hypothetical protein
MIMQVLGNHFITYCKQEEMASFVVSDTKFHNRYYTYWIVLCSVADPHPACHFDADADPTFHFDAVADPGPTFHFDAVPDPYPDLSFQIKAQNLEIYKSMRFRIRIQLIILMRIWIRIQLITLMRIRILLFNMMRIHNTGIMNRRVY